jgi:hypothetical protein
MTGASVARDASLTVDGRIQILRRHEKIPGRVYIDIDQDKCTDCGMCYRAKICPVNALYQPAEPWPREVRAVLSNPLTEYKGSQVPGRGTEEMKTNDVSGRFRPGEVGVGIELGRPGVGAYFRDVEVVAMALSPLGYGFAEENPVTQFMSNKKTGKLRDDVLNERATSAIIEGKCKLADLPKVLETIKRWLRRWIRFLPWRSFQRSSEGKIPILPILKNWGIGIPSTAKTTWGWESRPSNSMNNVDR